MKDVVILVGLEKEYRRILKEYVDTQKYPINTISGYVGALIINDLKEKGIIN